MAIPSATEFVEKLRPAGGRRSGKRDFIVNVFLRQEGHISADHLVDLIRKDDDGISRATIYRTLQWMVDAGMARRVDFGELGVNPQGLRPDRGEQQQKHGCFHERIVS